MDNKTLTAEIASREAIAAYNGIMNNLFQTQSPPSSLDIEKLKEVRNAALDWAKSRLVIPAPEPHKPLEDLEFAHRGAFYYACYFHFKKSKKEIDTLIMGLDMDIASERKTAWLKVIEKFGRQPEKLG